MKIVREDDPTRDAAATLFKAWQDVLGLTQSVAASEIVQLASAKAVSADSPDTEKDRLLAFPVAQQISRGTHLIR